MRDGQPYTERRVNAVLRVSTAVVEPYNIILCVYSLREHTDFTVMLDNESLHDVCHRNVDIGRQPEPVDREGHLSDGISPLRRRTDRGRSHRRISVPVWSLITWSCASDPEVVGTPGGQGDASVPYRQGGGSRDEHINLNPLPDHSHHASQLHAERLDNENLPCATGSGRHPHVNR